MTSTVLDRSYEQRLAAITRANEVRVARARLKKAIKAGGIDPIATLLQPPDFALTMRVTEYLRSIPKVGQVKALQLMRRVKIAEGKTVGGMSDRQRDELVRILGARA